MKFALLLLAPVVAWAMFTMAIAADPAPGTATWGPSNDAADAATEADPSLAAADMRGAKANRLTIKQRRKLGLSVSNVRRVVLELRAQGMDTDNRGALSAAVLAQIMEENKAAYAELPPQFDWDAFLEFIERVIELVMKIIGLFSQLLPADGPQLSHSPPPVPYLMAA